MMVLRFLQVQVVFLLNSRIWKVCLNLHFCQTIIFHIPINLPYPPLRQAFIIILKQIFKITLIVTLKKNCFASFIGTFILMCLLLKFFSSYPSVVNEVQYSPPYFALLPPKLRNVFKLNQEIKIYINYIYTLNINELLFYFYLIETKSRYPLDFQWVALQSYTRRDMCL